MASAQRVVRSILAPSEPEARTIATPTIEAFTAAGWTLEESLWIPGDRRVGLGESLLLSPESQLLLEDEGTLRLAFVTDDPTAVAPVVAPPTRRPDVFEEIGGVRYRRLVPRFAIGLAVGIVGLLIVLALASSSGMLGGSTLMPDANGDCPVGFAPAWSTDAAGNVTARWCQRFP